MQGGFGGPIEYSFGDPGILSFLFREFAKACQAGWCFRLCPQTLKFREHFGSNKNQKKQIIYIRIYIYIIMKKISEVVKKLQELLHDLFFVIVFFLPYRFTGDCDYSNKYNRFSIANNILHDITAQLNYQ